MPSIAHLKPHPIPVPEAQECPADCDLSRSVLCWLRVPGELLADLAAGCGSDDAEVLRADLRATARRIDALIDFDR
jgi:hypothetical protein